MKTLKKRRRQNRTGSESGRIVVEGVGNLMHHIARCCQPIPGDDIIGFITKGRGISIHHADCEQLAELRNQAPSVGGSSLERELLQRLFSGGAGGGK
ncbi:hypothetical protein ACNKHW_17505 [Shigella flexneri]